MLWAPTEGTVLRSVLVPANTAAGLLKQARLALVSLRTGSAGVVPQCWAHEAVRRGKACAERERTCVGERGSGRALVLTIREYKEGNGFITENISMHVLNRHLPNKSKSA